MPFLVKAGLVELALGGLSGWLVVITLERPEWLRRARVQHPPRLRQAHLDWIMMGTILVAVGAAVPGIPDVIAALVVFGAYVNPALFLPLAFDADTAGRAAFRALTAVSFLAMSGGLTALAVHGLTR